MKTRASFITNSSSCSFAVIVVQIDGSHELVTEQFLEDAYEVFGVEDDIDQYSKGQWYDKGLDFACCCGRAEYDDTRIVEFCHGIDVNETEDGDYEEDFESECDREVEKMAKPFIDKLGELGIPHTIDGGCGTGRNG